MFILPAENFKNNILDVLSLGHYAFLVSSTFAMVSRKIASLTPPCYMALLSLPLCFLTRYNISKEDLRSSCNELTHSMDHTKEV